MCIGRVVCPDKTAWTGNSCEPEGSLQRKSRGNESPCTFRINSIPSTIVYLDGVELGRTPRMSVPAPSGSHTFLFISDRPAGKSVTVTCAPGETKTVMVKLAP